MNQDNGGSNMKSKISFWGLLLFLLAAVSLLSAKQCQAASADVELTADKMEVTVGDNIFIYASIDSYVEFGNFEANVTYDDNLLSYSYGSSVVKGGNGFLKISDMNVLDGDKSRKYTLKFEALKVGICDIAFNGPVMVYDFTNGYEMSVSSNSLTLNIKAPKEASSNASLKTLKIGQGTLSPEFDPRVNEYSTTVDNATTDLAVTAIPQDSKATVSILGNETMKEGENKVVIHVLAESGAVIEYTINVMREFAPILTLPPVAENNTFVIEVNDGNTYAVYNGKYKLIELSGIAALPKGYEKSSIMISGVEIPIYVPIDNLTSDFVLIYATNAEGEAGFYQYDKREKTLQRFHLVTISDDNNSTDNQDIVVLKKQYNSNLRKAAAAIALLGSLSTLLIVVSVWLMLKLREKKNDLE